MAGRILYKYYSWAKEYHKRALTLNTIYFASPREFNDPFDCKINARYDLLTDEQLMEIANSLLTRNDQRPISEEEVKRSYVAIQSGDFRKPSNLTASYERMDKVKESRIGLFCLSELNDNLLMWSHYGAAHAGFCIGYDTSLLDKHFERLFRDDGLLVKLFPVQYMECWPKNEIFVKEKDIEKYMLPILTTKAKDWDYEKEHRYIITDKTDIQYSIPKEAIAEVILGCRMSESDRAEIKAIIQGWEKPPRLFQTQKKKYEFGLDVVPID